MLIPRDGIAIVQAALKHLAGCQQVSAPDLYLVAEAHLHLWLLQRQQLILTAETADSQAVNAAMQMLSAVAGRAASLAKLGYEGARFEAGCSAARAAVSKAVTQRAQQAAATYTLPALDGQGSPCGPGSWRCPRGTVPPAAEVRHEGEGMEEAKRRAALNLGSLPLPKRAPQSVGQLSFAALLQLLQTQQLQRGDDVAAQLALCLVEQELFSRAAGGSFVAEAALEEAEVAALAAVVDAYRTGGHSILFLPGSFPDAH